MTTFPSYKVAANTSRWTCKIYLADLASTYYGISPGTIPIASGYLAAYLKKQYGQQVDIRIFRTLQSLLEAVKSTPPDIAGFSLYAWNPRLAVLASELVKRMSPHTLTVGGGPSVELAEAMNAEYLLQNPSMDCLVWHEGEIALANIVESVLEHGEIRKVKQQAIDGACFLGDGQLIAGKRVPLVTPLEDTVPSPYLTGLFDELLNDGELMPLIQTTRGCPYACTFCVSGQPIYNKLRAFSVERVKEELLYLKNHAANRSIRFTDDNFGLLERDIEIAKYVRELYDTDRYPTGLKIYYAKLISERIKECSLILKPLLPLCMSFQSLTSSVLEEIKRPNNTREKFEETRRWARKHEVVVATELLFGLPTETFESFVKSLDGVVELRIDSVFPHSVWLLDGAELSSKASREAYGLKTKFRIGADGITQFNDVVSVEYEEYVVETNCMTADDFYSLNQLGLFAYWFIGYGFLKEVLYHCVTSGITLSQMFEEIVQNLSTYPVIAGLLMSYDEEVKASFFESRDDVERHVAASVRGGKRLEVTRLETVYVGKMIKQKEGVIEELKRVVLTLGRRRTGRDSPEFEEITEMLCDLSKNLLVPLGVDIPDVSQWRCRYDLVRWRREDYQRPLSYYAVEAPLEFNLVMNNIAQTRMTNLAMSQMTDDSLRIQYYLRNTNSSNVRRRIAYGWEPLDSVDMHLLNLEGFVDAAESVRPDDFPH